MIIEQLYTGCLAEAAYYIESQGEAAIIDPLREYQPYLDLAEKNNSTIKYIFETHFHADFVSGHIDLAKKTGATIVYGPMANPSYDVHIAKDKEELKIGKVTIRVLHTPGHTMESTTYLLLDEDEKPHAIFTGDTLFLGDVGRPDLAVSTDVSQEELAGLLYESLRTKIMPLPDEVIVYPAHGAGSACGKHMSKETSGSLGEQKKTNYALRSDMTKEEFIKELTEGLSAPPQYFPKNAALNKMGYSSFDEVLKRGIKGLTVEEFKLAWKEKNALILDTRNQSEYVKSSIPGSVFIGIDGSFAMWVGALIEDLNTPILFICDRGREEEVVTRLSRVGYDNAIGYLEGGYESWLEAGGEQQSIDSISPSEYAANHPSLLLDVRKPSEFEAGHIVGAVNYPLDFIHQSDMELDKDESYYIHCAGGYRSVIAASILKNRGFEKVVNIEQGYKGLKSTNLNRNEFVAQ